MTYYQPPRESWWARLQPGPKAAVIVGTPALAVVLCCGGIAAITPDEPDSASVSAETTTAATRTPTATPATTPAPRRTTPPPPKPSPTPVYYANCDEAEDALAAPILQREPGYRPALDTDRNGIACDEIEIEEDDPPAAGGNGDSDDDSGGYAYYKNCTAARAAGAAPVHRGDPGYGRHLDRDGDGVGCE